VDTEQSDTINIKDDTILAGIAIPGTLSIGVWNVGKAYIYVYKDFMPNIMVNEGKTTSNLKGQ